MDRPQAFTFHVPDAAIADLKERLARTRWPDEPPLEAWSTGTSVTYAQELCAYWRDSFDWRAWEAKLNGFRQFTVPIGGIDLHYLHVPGKQPDAPPLLISHGWPGSVFEFHKLIPLLAERFTIIAPSLPGYTLSFKPGQKRFSVENIADVYAELMTNVLSYKRFGVQGGDWGCFVASVMGHRYPQHVSGIHINMLAVRRDPAMLANPTPEEKSISNNSTTFSRRKSATSGSRAPSLRRSHSASRTLLPALRPGSSRSSAPGRITTATLRAR